MRTGSGSGAGSTVMARARTRPSINKSNSNSNSNRTSTHSYRALSSSSSDSDSCSPTTTIPCAPRTTKRTMPEEQRMLTKKRSMYPLLPSTPRQRHAASAALLRSKAQQLRACTQQLREALEYAAAAAAAGSRDRDGDDEDADEVVVAGAWDVYAGMQKTALGLVRALTLADGEAGGGRRRRRRRQGPRPGAVEETVGRFERLSLGGSVGRRRAEEENDKEEVDLLGAALGGLGIADYGNVDDDDDDGAAGGNEEEKEQEEALRAWGAVVRRLREAHRAYRPGRDKDGDDGERARRARRYELLDRALKDVQRMLRMRVNQSKRQSVRECVIAPRGDVVLEFLNDSDGDEDEDEDGGDGEGERGNTSENDNDNDNDSDNEERAPILRFRVASAMLAETSPFFARLFATPAHGTVVYASSADEEEEEKLRLYRVPTTSTSTSRAITPPTTTPGSNSYRETDRHGALTILLCAAHLQHDRVPRAVGFEQLVAIAACCLRYECTAPVEMFVEHLWLPAWVHKAAAVVVDRNRCGGDGDGDGDGDGLVLVSYVFGLRRLFERVTKTAVLGLVDEAELAAKAWPARVKDRIWAVRNAKMAQVYAACSNAVQEYFGSGAESRTISPPPPPPPPPAAASQAYTRSPAQHPRSSLLPSTQAFSFTTTPRCPKGSHACDAANLGWLLLVLHELQLLPTAPASLIATLPPQHAQQQQQPPRRSLAELLDVLRSVPSPVGASAHPSHAGVCDPALALRAAVNDVYNSVAGLTLFEVDGKRHGWALSRGKARETQSVLNNIPLGVLAMQQQEEESGGGGDAVQANPRGRVDVAIVEPFGTGEDGGQDAAEQRKSGLRMGVMDVDAPPPSPPLAFAFQPNEAICLRILSFLTTSDDLYAAAATSRTFYAAFKRHELALMRRLVKANRRLTLSMLAGSRANLFGKEETPTTTIQVRTAKDPDSGCVMMEEHNDPWLAGTEAHVMTEDEAYRILWPEEPRTMEGDCVGTVNDGREHVADVDGKTQGLGSRGEEKVLVSQHLRVEDKTLLVMGDKSLREQLDRRKGISSD